MTRNIDLREIYRQAMKVIMDYKALGVKTVSGIDDETGLWWKYQIGNDQSDKTQLFEFKYVVEDKNEYDEKRVLTIDGELKLNCINKNGINFNENSIFAHWKIGNEGSYPVTGSVRLLGALNIDSLADNLNAVLENKTIRTRALGRLVKSDIKETDITTLAFDYSRPMNMHVTEDAWAYYEDSFNKE